MTRCNFVAGRGAGHAGAGGGPAPTFMWSRPMKSTLASWKSSITATPCSIAGRDQHGATSYTTELGTGLTPWWHSELELGFDRAPGINEPTLLTQAVWENMFQLTEPGEQFADVGFYFEYGQST